MRALRRALGAVAVVPRAGAPEAAGDPAVTPVERLGHTVALFAGQVGALAACRSGRAADPAWSPLAALVRVTVRHERFAATVLALLDGRRPIPPPVEHAGINAAALARERTCPPGRLIARLLRAQTTLEALASRADAAGLRFAFEAGGPARPWPAALAVVERQVRDRLEEATGTGHRRVRATWAAPTPTAAEPGC